MIRFIFNILLIHGFLLCHSNLSAEDLSNETKLFGVVFKNAGIDEMREAIIKNGGIPLGERGFRHQEFKSKAIIEESETLRLLSDSTGRLYRASYKFPSFKETEQITKIRRMIEHKYGLPYVSDGNEKIGKACHEWKLADGIYIVVFRDWPDTTTWLHYINPEIDKIVKAESEEIDRRREREKAESIFHAI